MWCVDRRMPARMMCRIGWALVLVLSPAAAALASAVEGGGADAVVLCESEDLRLVQCPMDVRGGVDMVRQLSGNSCIREVDWGVDQQGVWVARGCRAEFRARTQEATGVVRQVLRCESRRGGIETCPVSLRGAPVRLLRQLSAFPCRPDESWGVGRNEIWVARGCKGEFEIGDRDGGFPPGPRLLTCESKGKSRRFCGASVGQAGVILVNQLSGMACEEGTSWGWDRDGVWVDDGCRAEFALP